MLQIAPYRQNAVDALLHPGAHAQAAIQLGAFSACRNGRAGWVARRSLHRIMAERVVYRMARVVSRLRLAYARFACISG